MAGGGFLFIEARISENRVKKIAKTAVPFDGKVRGGAVFLLFIINASYSNAK